jgi:hypothetical protein
VVAEYYCTELFIVELTVAIRVILLEQGQHLLLRVVQADLFNGAHKVWEGHSPALKNVKVLEHLHEAGFFR